MMLATLDGVELPCQFQYTPLISNKRVNYKITAGGTVSQRSTPRTLEQGDIPFKLVAPGGKDTSALLLAYRDSISHTFTGYYGEEHIIEFKEFKVEVKGGWYFITGVMYVLCTVTAFDLVELC